MSHDESEHRDAVVVGGGVAGLIAARDLSERGLSVRLLEARDRFGGRAFSGAFAGSGPMVEYGGGWFDADLQHPLKAELDRYSIPYGPATAYATTRWFTNGQLRAGFPVPVNEGLDLEHAIVAINNAATKLAADGGPQADDISVVEWIDQLKPTRATRDFLYGWIGLMVGADLTQVSMLGMLELVVQAGGVFSWFSDLRHVFVDGTGSLCGALADDLKCPADLGRPVTHIQQSSSGVTVQTADRGNFAAHVCVLAVPINVIPSIAFTPALPAQRHDPLVLGHACRVSKLWIQASGVPHRMLGAGWGTPFHWLAAEKDGGDETQIIVAFAMDGAVDTQRRSVENALRAYAPEAHVHAVDHHDWNSDRYSRGGWSAGRLGWAADGTDEAIREPHGRVVFAGSDVDEKFGGWIAGAVHSGRSAARAAAEMVTRTPRATEERG